MSDAMTERPLPTGEGLTFEKVWAMFQETDRKMEENARQLEENARQMKETERQMKITDRKIGELGNRFGELVEHLVAPSIMEKFNEIGFFFTKKSENVDIREPHNPDSFAEIDILLENGDVVIAVEVKAKPNQNDINDHINRIEILKRAADRHGDTRKYRGAIAGAIMPKELRSQILRSGFYAIEQTGDTVKINIPEGFTPREW